MKILVKKYCFQDIERLLENSIYIKLGLTMVNLNLPELSGRLILFFIDYHFGDDFS